MSYPKSVSRNQKAVLRKLLFSFFFTQLFGLAAVPSVLAQTVLPPNADIPTSLNAGNYNLALGGAATWNTNFVINSAARSNISIDGRGNTILVAPITYMFGTNVQNNNVASVKNAIVTTNPSTANTHLPLFYYGAAINSTLNLEGSTFTGFGGTGAGYDGIGANIIYVAIAGSNITVDGGTDGVVFSKNRGTGDSAGAVALYGGSLTFTGKVTFDSNWTGNYGGAVAVYSAANTLNFDGTTTFTNNHSTVFGGALDLWGAASSAVTFNGATSFDGNYVYYVTPISTENPGHVTDQNPRGGAINVGYVSPGTAGTSLTFNAPVSFTNNYVVSSVAGKNALGGAISVFGNNVPALYRLTFNNSALFQGNYAAAAGTNTGNGGAIYYDSSAAVINLSSGTQFLNNYAKTLGGAIYLQSGTVNLNASTADITFQGNRQGVSFDASFKPIVGTGTPNAIYLGSSGNLNLTTSTGQTIHLYDPIASLAGSTVTVTKTGGGEAILYGDNGATSLYDSNIQADTSVQGGYFTLANGVKYGSTAAGSFSTQSSGTTRGSNGAELRANSFVVASGGTLGVTGGTFTINSPLITLQGGSTLNGYGTLTGASNFNLTGIVTADIAASTTLNAAGLMSGAGGITKVSAGTLNLSGANTYTGATTVNAGTLSTGIANAFASSSAVAVNAGSTLALNSYNQTAQNLSGGGTISLGSAALTENNSGNTTFSGNITGTGSLIKIGTGNLTLSGASSYSGGTTISQGRLIATGGSSLGSGIVNNASALELAFAADGTLVNQFSGAGSIFKTGAGTATLTNGTSSVGVIDVQAGTLSLAQTGTFTAGTYTTETGASTTIGTSSKLNVSGAFTQSAGSALTVGIGANNNPAITAGSANLNGSLAVSGVNISQTPRASELIGKQFTILETTSGITGDFSSVDFGSTSSPADYLILAGRISSDTLTYSVGMGLTWLAGTQNGNGIFTLTNPTDTFDVDVVLANQVGPFNSGWTGVDLTKNGAGNLTLSALNTYTGSTIINAGTLTAGIADAFANSSAVTVNTGATLALNGYSQTAQNLSGGGAITLGAATLTASNSSNTTFSGEISGVGGVVKTGTGNLTLSGTNTYSGGTIISDGTLIATNGSSLGAGAVNNTANLNLDFAVDSTLANQLSGTGTILKTGTGITTLTNSGSSVGAVDIQAGTLFFDQDGVFTAGTYTTESGAATTIGTSSTLNIGGTFSKGAGAALNLMIGMNNLPAITANSAVLGGDLTITGFDITLPASVLTATRHTILQTTTGITGDFSTVDFGGLAAGVDYLLLNGAKTTNNLDYTVGFALTWTSGAAQGNGLFTLLDESNAFDVDVLLADQTGPFASGWNGRDLTKNGAGTLILSYQNTYSGITTVNRGLLSLQHDTALGLTSELDINSGATVNLNGTSQTVGKLITESGSTLNFGGGILTITDAQRTAGDTSGGTIQADTLFGNGGLVIDPSIVEVIGANAGYTGDVTVTGGSQLIMNNAEGVGNSGIINLAGSTDTLTFETLAGVPAVGSLEKLLAGVGIVQTLTDADITLAGNNTAFSGVFDVGTSSTLRASSAANLGSADVQLDGTFVATAISNWTMLNPVTGNGSFYKDGTAQLLIYGTLSNFTGPTYVTDGALIVGDASMINATVSSSVVNVSALGTLSGTGIVTGSVANSGTIAALNSLAGYEGAPAATLTVGTLNNSGTIQLAGSTVGNQLVVRGGMTSDNGTLIINTVMGHDTSPTDKLVLDGGSNIGSTTLIVRNQNGRGAQTIKGIQVVEAINGATTTSDAFILSSASSGYRSTTGTLAIGGFDYSLLRGGVGGQADSWYLASTMEEVRPEAGIYLINREAAENMFVQTMHDRFEGYETIVDPETGKRTSSPVWARLYGNKNTTYAGNDQLCTKTDMIAFQAGADVYRWSDDSKGAFRTGMILGKGTTSNDTTALWDRSFKSTGDVDGYSAGIYAAWFQNSDRHDGFYVDTWLQHGWFDNDVKGDGLPKEKYRSRLWAVSLEGGYAFPMNKIKETSLFFEPSIQLIYSKYSAKDFQEEGGTVIHQDNDNKWTTRLGGRIFGLLNTKNGTPIEPFVEANWWHTNRKTQVSMDQNIIYSDRPNNIGEIRAGMKSRVQKNLFMNFDVSTQFGNHNYSQYGAQIGIRYQW